MFYNNLKKILIKFPPLWKFLRWFKDSLIILSRLKDVLMMMILFHIWPEQTYRFSTRGQLPSKKNRSSKKLKPVIPYDLLNTKSSKIPTMKEINVVGLGPSFDLNYLKKIKGPTFLFSFWFPLKIDNKGNIIYLYDPIVSKKISGAKHLNTKNTKNFKRKNLTYVQKRIEYVKLFKKNACKVLAVSIYGIDKHGKSYSAYTIQENSSYLKMFNNSNCQRISLNEKIYKSPFVEPNPYWAPTGSFLPALCALSFFAKKINVYGWDFYLKSSPEKMSYIQLFFNMYNYKLDTSKGRSKNHFESAIVNVYYAYKLSKLPNINIHGYLGKLTKHKKLINRIEKVLFN